MRLKTLLSMLLIATLVLVCFSTAVQADGVYPIVIKNAPSGHTYEAYQIFVGTLYEEYDAENSYLNTILADIEFGNGLTQEGKAALLAKYSTSADVDDVVESLTDSAAAHAFAAEIEPYLAEPDASSDVCDTANENSYTLSITAPGYYLVRDAEGSVDGEDTAATAHLLKITRLNEATVLNLKMYTVPTPEKFVAEPDEAATELADYDWSESADVNVGDDVVFHLVAEFPGNTVDDEGNVLNFDGYSSYAFSFHDTLTAGLTLAPESFNVYANGDSLIPSTDYVLDVTAQADGTTKVEIIFEDLTALDYADKESEALVSLNVTYTATLNADAVVADAGNQNRLYLEYSNDPNQVSTGLSKEVDVDVFTYGLKIFKVDTASAPLGGAKFVILRKTADLTEYLCLTDGLVSYTEDSTQATVFTSSATDGTVTVEGLENGTYYAREIQAPAGYNLLGEDVEITVDGAVSEVTVTNDRGFVLPETGSTGTALFYLFGATLLLAAGVVLYAKKRASNH